MSETSQEQQPRQQTNALFNSNRLKLGLFGINCDSGCAMTTAPEREHLTWASTRAIAQAADRAGFEALVPVARWKGLGGETNFNGRAFDTYTWAAGLAAATEQITLVTTSHVQTIHPMIAAKQAATIDHISGGRYALNIVCGWFHPELEMFGAPFMEHDARYDYAEEWFDIVSKLWIQEGDMQYNGDYFTVKDGFSMPKPLQAPLPPVINAGGSDKGKSFIARRCDIGYIVITDHDDLEKTRVQVEDYRKRAADAGREIQVWTHAYVIQRDTEQEARDYLHRITVEYGNEEAAENAANYLGLNSKIMPPDAWQQFKTHLKAGYGGLGIVGTAETVAAKLQALSDVGVDGVSLHWVNYLDGLERFTSRVLPLLEQAGLRSRHRVG